MKREKKIARSQAKLAELFGLDAPEKPTGPSALRVQQDTSREGEAVLHYIAAPTTFRQTSCKRCKREFMVNRANVSFCSDQCRAKDLEDIGITWNWNRSPEERWYYAYDGDPRTTEPLVIGPEATAILTSDDFRNSLNNVAVAESDSSIDDDFLYNF